MSHYTDAYTASHHAIRRMEEKEIRPIAAEGTSQITRVADFRHPPGVR